MPKRIADSVSPPQQCSRKSRVPSIPILVPQPQLPEKCCFLDMLPLELRLTVYEYLVVSPPLLSGSNARNEDQKTGLNLGILAANRQIHAEALPLFYAKNTFHITSIPDHQVISDSAISSPCLVNFDPPLPKPHWPLIRHLTINLLYLPQTLVSEPGLNGIGWKPVDAGAASYITHLVAILTACGSKLLSLSLTVDVPPSFCAKKCLVGFFMCDRDRSFAYALASASNVKSIPLSFEFPDCYYRIPVPPGTFTKKSILLLACQVMFCQSRVRVMTMLEEFEGGQVVEGARGRRDLGPFVDGQWR